MMLSRCGWMPPPDRRPWPDGAVHVWRARLDWPDASAVALEPILSGDERERIARLHFQRDRRRSLISRGLLRTLLGRYLDMPPEALAFGYSPYGKPALAVPDTPLRFNVSHSGELLLIAVTLERALGVDVEEIRRDMEVLEIAARFFSPSERDRLASVPEVLRHDAFFDCWTRKEAYIKAKGDGLSLPLDQFDVAFGPGLPARLLATRPDQAEARRWWLRELDVAEGYKAALAVEGAGLTLACWDWPTARYAG
ncbi:MAG: 4'-phosphopantetheinyl transferase superfamily protein [Hyphomicrobiaceae bacterium]|nr:4'-phosphopantetheinyl transferase superfamily protein [Hyphomicrobiaceae bacterium]